MGGGGRVDTTEQVFYGIEGIIYLVLIVFLVTSLRGIRRELKRIADRLYRPVGEEAPTED